ncbi:UDP-N-acetylglucosamine transferase subunit ALG14-like protein [Huso huso]|uniref:UDP-N-acetylglucosamine transferase subunit ALG14 n=1 Tax=Huso huso TaxID=61971 RepID=A0ABR0ZHC6_HUSHU
MLDISSNCYVKMGLILGAIVGLLITFFICTVRLFLVLRKDAEHKPGKKGAVSVLVVAGSGGHTTEILRLMESLSRSYSPRHYVIADTDKMSEDKIRTLENSHKEKDITRQFTIQRIPRSREVQQSWRSSVLTTLYSLLYSVPLVFKLKPDLVLCNGPGTCVPVCASALFLGFLGVKKVLIIYVESICRVETLSLSGKLLYHLSDYFFVQWSTLKEKYPKSTYLGRIV